MPLAQGLEMLKRVLIIDDEMALRRLLKLSLEAHGHVVLEAKTGEEGLLLAAREKPDLILLDLGLPDQDGSKVLERLREWATMPVIILSVRDDELSVVTCLDKGADDYLRKPFGIGELFARLRVCARKQGKERNGPAIEWGPLKIDIANHLVLLEGTEIRLTNIEFGLLALLARHGGKILTHAQILKEIWGPDAATNVEYLRVYIGHLRQKLEKNPSRSKLIVTEPGIGYRLAAFDYRGE